jgi:hypothetical protein
MSNAPTIPVPAMPDATTKDGVTNPCDIEGCGNPAASVVYAANGEEIDLCETCIRECVHYVE